MKKWSVDDWIRFIFAVMIGYCVCTYFTGMFILKQETNEINLQLRIALVGLLTFIAAQLLIKKEKKDDEK